MDVMMMLGPYIFSVDTAAYNTLQRSTSYRWQSQDRIGTAPAQQYVGKGSDTITMSGTILPHYKGGILQVTLMRAVAGLGMPLLLMALPAGPLLFGEFFGMWCITSISETHTEYTKFGIPLKIDFNLTISSYTA